MLSAVKCSASPKRNPFEPRESCHETSRVDLSFAGRVPGPRPLGGPVAVLRGRGAPMTAVLPDTRAAAKKAAHEINKLSKRLHRQGGQAIAHFNIIEDGDKVMV